MTQHSHLSISVAENTLFHGLVRNPSVLGVVAQGSVSDASAVAS